VRSCEVEGNERVVTFQSGATARERLVTVEAETCRICYSVVGGRFEHHNASMQVRPSGSGKSVVRWTTDLLPNHLAPMVQAMMEEGARAIVAEQQRQGTSHSPAPERSGAR
jgi:carbon monoxide dehydrogenase subunit G